MDSSSLRWRVGEVEIIQLVEMEENKLFSTFIPEAKPERIKEIKWLAPNFADEKGILKALVQSFLIKSCGKNILVDTCNGNGKNRPNLPTWGNLQTNFLEKFEEAGGVERIDFVVCTHLHFDHVGWNTRFENGKWVPTFPNASYIFSKGEYEYWIKRPEKEMIDDLNGVDDSVKPIIEAGLAKFVADDYQIDENVRFIPTPGHTSHHVSVIVESLGEKAIISGDVLFNPCQVVHQDWTTLSDGDPGLSVSTRKKFLNEVKDKNVLVIGSHFYYPVAGRVVTGKDGLLSLKTN